MDWDWAQKTRVLLIGYLDFSLLPNNFMIHHMHQHIHFLYTRLKFYFFSLLKNKIKIYILLGPYEYQILTSSSSIFNIFSIFFLCLSASRLSLYSLVFALISCLLFSEINLINIVCIHRPTDPRAHTPHCILIFEYHLLVWMFVLGSIYYYYYVHGELSSN